MSILQKYLPGKITLTNDKLQAYLLDLSLFDEEAMLPLLSADEKERAARLKFKDKRQQFVNTRAILREIISRSLVNTKPEAIIFNYGEHGKPQVNHTYMGKQIEFNVSHSGHYALIAITVIHPVGVDIEAIVSKTERQTLAKRFFSEAEIANLKTLPENEQAEAFFRCWTRKEAFIKAEGTGVGLGLNTFSVSLDDKINAAEIAVDSSVDIAGKWYSYQPITVPGFQTSIATNTDKLHVTAHVITNSHPSSVISNITLSFRTAVRNLRFLNHSVSSK